ncbi:phospholipid carrier-dependent glycosyltransferase [bacterium]|nr:phospholipid carrier-dependent glycosyltransferase [bacterium]
MSFSVNDRKPRRTDPRWAGIAAFLWVCLGVTQVGVTIDEPLDVAPGRHYWKTAFDLKGEAFGPEGVRRMFGGNPDHPPLARWVLGAFSYLLEPVRLAFTGNADPTGLNIAGARIGSAAAFGLTIALLGHFVTKRHGRPAGWAAAISYACLPHVFGHAHLAALESVLNLTWFLAVAAWLRWSESPAAKRSLLAGFGTGLACLTKLQGWLILPWIVVVIFFTPTSWRSRLAGFAGLATVPLWWVAGWPWMWYESSARLRAYFLSSVDRTHLNVMYFGQIYADDRLPWHYAVVQWFASVPPVVLVLCATGAFMAWRTPGQRIDRSFSLIPVGLLVLFSLPIARYDTDRLFLVLWPAVAALAGTGFEGIRRNLAEKGYARWSPVLSGAVLAILLIVPCLKPSPLSYVSPLAGGIRGFESRGMDLNYWGDAVDSTLMDEIERLVKPGEKVAVVPTLAGGQAAFLTPDALLRKGMTFEEQSRWRDAHWLVIYRRPSYWPEGLDDWIRSKPPVAVRQRDGVWLAAIWCGPKGSCEDR